MDNNFEDFDLNEERAPEESFHIEIDLYDSGDYANLLVIPCNGTYIIVGNNEHLSTVAKNCDEPECWEQQEGNLDDEVVEKLGSAISGYISSI